ncbi:MAG: ankyrin repeat domain-containing protein [Victivallales bacterium]|nr:ankyrin repeat domain-containing protein [Victivallales bacterium]
MKNILSDKVRAAFWTVLTNVGWPYSGLVWEGCEDMVLVDNKGIRSAILKRKKKGYDLIPQGIFFMDDKRFISLSEKMLQALQLDSPSMFEMALTLTGKKISAGLIRAILCASASNILIHLMKQRSKLLANILSPLDLLISICVNVSKNEAAVKVLDALEELFPGISKSTDKLGNTPLWYCLYKRRTDAPLVQALLRYGCNPDQRNHLNLSWRICAQIEGV